MNATEAAVEKDLRALGIKCFRNGWPDLLCIDRTRGTPEVFGVEIKSEGDILRPEQKRLHRLLKSVGVPVYVLGPNLKPPRRFLGGETNCWREMYSMKKLLHQGIAALRYQSREISARLKGLDVALEELKAFDLLFALEPQEKKGKSDDEATGMGN